MSVKPISPNDVEGKKLEGIPDQVIEAFNELIAKNWRSTEAVIKQRDVVKLILEKLNIESGQIYDNGWLDVEPVYRKAGWNVEYDKPAYCESYEPTFTFRKKRK